MKIAEKYRHFADNVALEMRQLTGPGKNPIIANWLQVFLPLELDSNGYLVRDFFWNAVCVNDPRDCRDEREKEMIT